MPESKVARMAESLCYAILTTDTATATKTGMFGGTRENPAFSGMALVSRRKWNAIHADARALRHELREKGRA